MRRIQLVFLLLLLSQLSFAALKVAPLDLTFAVPVVGVIVIALLGATTMLASSISDPKLQAWVKTEIREFFAGAILIVIVMALFVSSSGVSIALTGTADYASASQAVLDKWLNKFDDAYAGSILAAARIRTAATFAPYMNAPTYFVSISYSTNPLSGIATVLVSLTMATQGLTNAIFLTEALRMLIIYMKIIGPKILLPLSFILRLVPFTRKTGNTMIALSLAGMVLLPYGVIAAEDLNSTLPPKVMPNAHLSSSALQELTPEPISLITWIVEPFCQSAFIRTMLGLTDPLFGAIVCLPLLFTPWTAAAFVPCQEFVANVVYPVITDIFQLVMAALLLTWEAYISAQNLIGEGWAGRVFDAIHPFLVGINNLVLLTYLDHILILTITVAGARSISTALGGEWYMAGIQRLI
jgi:hypothetical protein